jgi:hypothetical protein
MGGGSGHVPDPPPGDGRFRGLAPALPGQDPAASCQALFRSAAGLHDHEAVHSRPSRSARHGRRVASRRVRVETLRAGMRRAAPSAGAAGAGGGAA